MGIALQRWLAGVKQALEQVPLLGGRITALERGLEQRAQVVEPNQRGFLFLEQQVAHLQWRVIDQEGDFGQAQGPVADLKKSESKEKKRKEKDKQRRLPNSSGLLKIRPATGTCTRRCSRD